MDIDRPQAAPYSSSVGEKNRMAANNMDLSTREDYLIGKSFGGSGAFPVGPSINT